MKRHSITALAIAAAMSLGATAALAQADNTNSRMAPAQDTSHSWSGWMQDYSSTHHGRISRQAYFDEMGRRWDAADARRQGLSVEEINRLYGPASSDQVTGAITAPGYMGQKDVKK
ncbi:MAG TPA: hypothetical protein VF147_04705 [Vicinamibacterales bacterium]